MKTLIIEFRLLIAWLFIGWALKAMPNNTPDKKRFAAAIKGIIQLDELFQDWKNQHKI